MAITLRPSDEQLEQIEVLKKSLNINTSSKALFGAAAAYPKLKDDLERERQKSQQLEWKVDELQRSIRSYHHAKEEMLSLADFD